MDATVGHKKRYANTWSSVKKHREIYLILLPPVLYFIIYQYIPMLGLVVAFQDFNIRDGFLGSEWVGLDNFTRLFKAYYFVRIMQNTVEISLLRLTFGFPAPIILALVLNELKNLTFKRIVQTITYLPHFLSWIIMAGLMITMLSPSTGLVNHWLSTWFGMEKIFFLGDPNYFRGVLVSSAVWKGVGWGAIIYLAALSGVDAQLYDAAIIDGATKLQQAVHVTIPSIIPMIVIMLILRIGDILDAGFNQILSLYSPSVYKVADIIDTYVYREGLLQANYSYATAVGMFKGVVGLLLVWGANRFSKWVGQEGLW